MEDIIFSSWQGELVDNRTVAEGERKQPGNVKLPPEFAARGADQGLHGLGRHHPVR